MLASDHLSLTRLTWLDSKAEKALPKGKLGKAICSLGRRDGYSPAVPGGGDTSTILHTPEETAKANGLDPHAYLTHVFEHLLRAKTPEV